MRKGRDNICSAVCLALMLSALASTARLLVLLVSHQNNITSRLNDQKPLLIDCRGRCYLITSVQ